MAAGEALAVADVRECFEPPQRAAQFEALGIGSLVNAAYVDDGAWKFVLHASRAEPTAWLPQDVELIREVAERTYPRIARARAEAALRESDERLRLALAAAATGLWTWDLASDAVTWSPECYAIHGIAEGAFGGTGAAFFRYVHPEDRARVETEVRRAIDSRALYECEFRIVRPDTTVLWVTNRGRCSYDAGGRPLRVLGTITDISDRKQAEDERRASEENLRLALSAAKAGVWGWDIRTGVVTWSPENYALYGLEPMDAPPADDDWEKHIHPDDLGPSNAAVEDALRAGRREFHSEFRCCTRAKAPAGCSASGRWNSMRPPNRCACTASTSTSPSARRFEGALAAQDQRKDEFLATLAHELRNPLASIGNGLELLKQAGGTDTVERLRAMMQRQLGNLVYLVDDLLDVSRVSQGKITLRRERVAVSAAVEAAVEPAAGDGCEGGTRWSWTRPTTRWSSTPTARVSCRCCRTC